MRREVGGPLRIPTHICMSAGMPDALGGNPLIIRGFGLPNRNFGLSTKK